MFLVRTVLWGVLLCCATAFAEDAAPQPAESSASTVPKRVSIESATPTRIPAATRAKLPEDGSRLEITEEGEIPGRASFGTIVRQWGERGGVSVVLMSGLEDQLMPEKTQLPKKPSEKSVEKLATAFNCLSEEASGYTFIYAKGYESLEGLSLKDKLPPRYAALRGSMAFGAGMPLYTACAWLSQAMGIAVVADNAVGSAYLGETALSDVTVAQALEAMLKGARVPKCSIEATDEFVFLCAPGNPNPASALLGPADNMALLEKMVNVSLPYVARDAGKYPVEFSAKPLGDLRGLLEQQLGVPVAIEGKANILPVNPMTVRNVRLRTALDLLVKQWLSADFCYEVRGEGIVIRPRTDAERVSAPAASAPAADSAASTQ